MNQSQKGISSIVIILIIVGVLVIGGGIWYLKGQKEKAVSLEEILSNPSKYNNKTVITEGFYFRGFETNVFCRGLEYSGYAAGHIRPAEPVIWAEDTRGVIKKEIIDKLYEQKMMGPTENYGKVKIKGYFESDGKYGHSGGYNYQLIPLEIEVLEWSLPEEIPGDETTTWKTYQNEKYGFEVKYPKEWKMQEYKLSSKVVSMALDPVNVMSQKEFETVDASPGLIQISFAVETEAPSAMKEGYDSLPGPEINFGYNNSIKAKKSDELTGNNQPNPTFNNRHLISYTILKDNSKSILIRYNSNPEDNYLQLFNQILSTFKFPPPESPTP